MDVEAILQKQGIEYKIGEKRFEVCCPFHSDETPSAGLWRDNGYFRCFGCHRESSFVEYLSEECGITITAAERLIRGDEDTLHMENRLRDFLQSDTEEYKYFSKKSFHATYPPLVHDTPEWDYVIGRGITEKMIKRFDLRTGVKKYRNRVVMPIWSPEGRLVSYVARAIYDGGRKSLKARSPHKTFFGIFEVLLSNTKKNILLDIVVVEGEYDAIYLQQFGIPAVANMGTMPLNPDKIRILKKYAKKVILSYDADSQGFSAMYGNVEKNKEGQADILNRYIPTRTITLPKDKDPNNLTGKQVERIYKDYLGAINV